MKLSICKYISFEHFMITEDWHIEGWFGPCWILGETPMWNRNLKPWKEFLEANVSLWQPYDPLKWGTNSQMEQGYVHIRQNSTEKDKLVVANICKRLHWTAPKPDSGHSGADFDLPWPPLPTRSTQMVRNGLYRCPTNSTTYFILNSHLLGAF